MTITDKEVEAILNTLETIEVKGFENMNKVMALIQFFKSKETEDGRRVSTEQNGSAG